MRIRSVGAKRVVLLGALAIAVAGISLVVAFVVGALGSKDSSAIAERVRSPRIGNVRALQASYERWKVQYAATEGDRSLVLPLAYSKGLSARFTTAQGQARLDLADGTIAVEVSGLAAEDLFDVWLVDNRPGPGRSVRPEPGDNMLRVGRLVRAGDAFALRERLGQELLTAFKLDLIVVAPAGGDPGTDGLLFATPSLFQRLYYTELRAPVAVAGGSTGKAWSPFSVLVPSPAWAQTSTVSTVQALVQQGEALFFEETFGGNGRTCGTCHPADNNLTLDRAFIARLPKSDPLFVAENNPDLADLENPVLMRRFALILENVDGFNNPGVMRGVPHSQALPTSLGPGNRATGWSGDGAPCSPQPSCSGPGTIRDFATGAVTQHFPKTLARMAGTDFVLPTPAQLDAMEAFQLSLGRQNDLNITNPALPNFLVFQSPLVEQGKNDFVNPTSGGGSCNACHFNAGANANFGGPNNNANFATGVEDFVPHPADLITPQQPRPRDAGFGQGANLAKGGFGDDTFNTPPLVEAADTPPFFHNNLTSDLVEAVNFYNSTAFNVLQAPNRQIVLNSAQVTAIAAFLRVINALENIRSSNAANEEAKTADSSADARSLLRFSRSELDDAIKVLNEQRLHPDAALRLRLARGAITAAILARQANVRNALINQAINLENTAKGLMVTEQ
jgi:cytochrome c peroxidase